MRPWAAMSMDYKRFSTPTFNLRISVVIDQRPFLHQHWFEDPRWSGTGLGIPVRLGSPTLNENRWAMRKWGARGSFGKLERKSQAMCKGLWALSFLGSCPGSDVDLPLTSCTESQMMAALNRHSGGSLEQ